MLKYFGLPLAFVLCSAAAQADPSLTIYNDNFAVIRDVLALDLKAGDNSAETSQVTALLEPDSVILRDPTGKRPLQILEQNYRADPASQGYLLSLFEGKTIDFRVVRGEKEEIVKGKIIRSGYQPGNIQLSYPGATSANALRQPLIEVNGQLRFTLPGEPLFPFLPEGASLYPTLNWILRTPQAGPLDAELAYISRGFDWKADYNVIAPPSKQDASPLEQLEVVGWVTLTNNSGKTFPNANLKLMAGDVNKLNSSSAAGFYSQNEIFSSGYARAESRVTENNLDEYHLYSLQGRTTLRDRETKQVEFLRVAGVKCESIYLYDGLKLNPNSYSSDSSSIRQDSSYGTQSNSKVLVMRSFENSKANNLGIPLPKGRLRFYRRSDDGQLEFTGENVIDHTPTDEMVRVATGTAFDLVGERKQVNFNYDYEGHKVDESFQITLRNRKKSAVDIRVVEHFYRGANWSLTQQSAVGLKRDSRTMEFTVNVPPGSEKVVTYTVRYTW